MAMGRKAKQRRQERFWVASTDLPQTVAHPFYEQLNRLLEKGGFDEFVEQQCASFYAERMGRPSLSPGRYFRLLLMGYFEGIDSERGMAWRAADSLGLRKFLSLPLEEMVADHSTISRTRRLIDVETHLHGISLGSGIVGGERVAEREKVGHRWHDPGSQCGDAIDRAPR